MTKPFLACFLLGVLTFAFSVPPAGGAETDAVAGGDASVAEPANPGDGPTKIFVIPIREQIGKPTLYIVRTGVKEAISAGAQFVLLDMNTPGGALDSTLEIMQILNDRFTGRTATYVNTEAISAGALISAATERIYFAPNAIIGAAAPVSATGEQIEETMRQKILSYLLAKVRSMTDEHRYRADVITAMVDIDYELKIDEKIIKEKGKLLSLTDKEAMAEYGDPPAPLLGSGIAGSLEELYEKLAEGRAYEVREFEMTWSIRLAQWITKLSPFLLSLGGLLLFIEYKTPGFGLFGIAGVIVVVIVLFGHNVAGLSGHESILVFLLGAVLVVVELFFFPGLLITAVLGILLMLGALLWGMADVWPGEAFELSPGMFFTPAYNIALGLLLAIVLGLLLARFLPKSVFWNRLVLAAAVTGSTRMDAGVAGAVGAPKPPAVGDVAVVVSDLHPVGRIEFGGRHYDARIEVGEAHAGERVRVVGRADFVYVVEPHSA